MLLCGVGCRQDTPCGSPHRTGPAQPGNPVRLVLASKYDLEPVDFTGLTTTSIRSRSAKINTALFAGSLKDVGSIGRLTAKLPKLLAADTFRNVVTRIREARTNGKAIIWGLGGHVIKCVLAELMEHGFATAFAMNGAAAIHDFEIALAGNTSEDVAALLPGGGFGTAEETGWEMNTAIAAARSAGLGMGEALSKHLQEIATPEFAPFSLLLRAYSLSVPVTVHVAIGTDTIHIHPAADGDATGAASYRDFQLFCRLLTRLEGGGVYINLGSAVLLPEVFLKALSAVRNLGVPLQVFSTVNMDFQQHYRPVVNVLQRPHGDASNSGFSLTGHHEIMLPLLAAALLEDI